MRAEQLDRGRPEEGIPAFYSAGDRADADVSCAGCGYGVSSRTRLPPCPMCGGDLWEDARTSGFGRSAPRSAR